ncbi:MFS transporter [Plantactinospora soyae]|uniref:MFS family permease n=1 Tax=Plantactinospora soyae TaxID=1544732 RepID=A0A927R626_9ACTN|nr:MFS transporter [Plantactinospora soyae]MBE1488024.1 MFS family permease [Plantactinospora soyae]
MTQQLTPPPATDPAPRPSLWRARNFLLLWSGQTVSELGTRISGIAIPLLAANDLDASVFQISLLTFLAWLPYLLFSLPAGILADRVDQRKLMIACDLGRMALLVSLPLVAIGGTLSLAYLYVVVGLSGVLTVLFTVAYRSTLPKLVAASQLVDANGKLGMSQEFAELVGTTIGGALIGAVGAARTFFSNGFAFLVSAVTLWLIREVPAEPDTGPADDGRPSVRDALTGGLSFIRRQPILSKLLACTTTSNFFVMASSSIEITFLVRELHASSLLVGLVFTISALGGLVAGAMTNRISARIGSARIIWVAMLVPGPLYLLMPLARPGWGLLLYGAGLAAFSANSVLFNAAAMSYRQHVTPARLLGRVNAAFLWVCYGVIPLGALFGGALGSQLGLRTALWICVLGTWSAALFVLFSPLRKMRDMPAV